jgi:hypothetical protein
VHESVAGTFRTYGTGLMMSAEKRTTPPCAVTSESDPQRIGAFSAHHESSDISCR